MGHSVYRDRDLERKVAIVEKKLQALLAKRLEPKKYHLRYIAKVQKKLEALKSELMD